MISNNFTEVKPLCYWVQHILPLVYDDSLSYMELLGRVTKKLNELIVNNNKLPDFIVELIKDYISSGAIEKVLAEVLADYMLNVKFPPAGLTPATGDGSADDTEAIQGCIDYAFNHGGMAVYFPSGKYLTRPLTLKNKATLFGQDRYSTILVMKGGATTAMFTGEVDELTLTGLGFDGNMDIQVNNVNLFDITVGSAIITNALLTDGYTLLNAVVNKDLQLDNIVFEHAVEHGAVLSGGGFVQADNLIFNSVSALVGKDFLTISTNNSIFEKIKLVGATPTGITVNGNSNIVKFWRGESVKAYTDNGVNNSFIVYTESKKEVLTGDVNLNAVNKKEVLTGDKTLDVMGNKTENVEGNNRETTTGDKEETANNKALNINETLNLNAKDIVLNSTNPTTYKKPTSYNRYFDVVPWKDNDENIYNVLVKKEFPIDYYNVKDYGAKGDGVNDDTSAIQSCFDSVMIDGGGLVIFPAGTYLISDTLIIRPHTASVKNDNPQSLHFISMDRLQVAGEGQAVLKATSDMDYMIRTYDFSYPANVGSYSNFYTHINGLKLDGNNLATNGIYVYQALHSIIEYNQIFNVVNGINIYGYGELEVRNNVIKCSGKGIVMTSGGDTLIEKNDIFLDDNAIGIDMTAFSGSTLINKNTFTPTYAGVESHNGMNKTIGVHIYNGNWNNAPATTGPVHISNNSFDGVLWGVKAYSSVAHKVCDIELFHNKLANNGYYTGINLFSGQNVENCMIHNNNGGVNYDYAGAIGKLVELTECTSCTIANNLVCASQDSPIKLYNSNANTVIGNTLLNPSLNDPTGAGIILQGTSINNVVKGNVIRQDGYGGNITHIGIAEQGSCNYNIANDNEFFGVITEKYQSVGANSYFHYTGYGYNAPTTGTWKKGDIIYNEEPFSDNKTFCWVCVTSGAPGVWGAVKWNENV